MIESKYLKDDMHNIRKLFSIPALRRFETKDLGKLLKLSKIRRYEDGEAIIHQGSMDKWVYFLLSGTIRIKRDDLDIHSIDKPGEIFGEMRIVDGLSRSTSVFAVGRTTCLAVDTASQHRLGSEDEAASLLALLYKVAAEFISIRLRLSNEQLVKIQKENRSLNKQIRKNEEPSNGQENKNNPSIKLFWNRA